MKLPQDRARTDTQHRTSTEVAVRAARAGPSTRPVPPLPLWRVNLLRVGYLVMGGGLAVVKWPQLVDHEPWGLMEGTVQCLLVAMSVLALLGLRYPLRMLPILLFEVGWKTLWLGFVALPLWSDGRLEGATRTQAEAVLWVVIVAAVIPWRYAVTHYLLVGGDPWRRQKTATDARVPSVITREETR